MSESTSLASLATPIATGQLDASAIDSMVLEMELRRNPVLGRSLRVVETCGPSPAPPWVVSRRLPSSVRRKLSGRHANHAPRGSGEETVEAGENDPLLAHAGR